METSPRLDLFPAGKLAVTLRRLCHQLWENYEHFDDTILLGAQPRGIFLAQRVKDILEELVPGLNLPLGELDATFFRDDFRRQKTPLNPNRTRINFVIENKHVILIDDVLYTGRTVRAALDAMLAYGRPASVALMVLVDRTHKRELPIEPSYVGIRVDTIETQRVLVELRESGGNDQVFLVETPLEED
ncbi:MAG: bifunctional pyr operon transcriptional regulator/uracil phosphoribosyltransferase PyrR [Bacteroidota bacterium]